MKEWFFGLEERERILVVAGAVVVSLLMLYALVWSPIAGDYRSLRDGVQEQKKTLQWMKQAAVQVKSLQRGSPAAAQGLRGRSLLAVVDQSVRSSGLGSTIKRIEPEGNKGVKVWLESVSFDDMILWLGKLTRTYQVQTTVITIEPQGGGRVNARLTLLEPGA